MACNSKTSVEKVSSFSLRVGVVDIGSNAIRLIIGDINACGGIVTVLKRREAVRLGESVFRSQRLSDECMDRAVASISQFAEYFREFQVDKVRAVATSAVRNAMNKDEFISRVFQETGVSIDVIDGHQESKFILRSVREVIGPKDLLIMDIGGGSVEFILSTQEKEFVAISLPLGAVRMIEDMKDQQADSNQSFRDALEKKYEDSLFCLNSFLASASHQLTLVGTGGNLECLGQLRKQVFQRKSHTKVKSHEIDLLVEELFALTFREILFKRRQKSHRRFI